VIHPLFWVHDTTALRRQANVWAHKDHEGRATILLSDPGSRPNGLVAGRAHSRRLDRFEARPNDAQPMVWAGSDVDGISLDAVDRLAICAKCGRPLSVRPLGTRCIEI
jgi:hypothetical protein